MRFELTWQRQLAGVGMSFHAWPLLAAVTEPSGTGALIWTALKVGALAFGGGFVIVPLMQSDAVGTYHWMTHGQFLNAVALGQVTPGPVTGPLSDVGSGAGEGYTINLPVPAGSEEELWLSLLEHIVLRSLRASRRSLLRGAVRARDA